MNIYKIASCAFLIFTFILLPLSSETEYDGSVMNDMINSYRIVRNLPALDQDSLLAEAAFTYACELKKRGALSHIDREERRAGERLQEVWREKGRQPDSLPYTRVGEILGYSSDEENVFEAWKQSESHRAILERSEWSACGSGAVLYEGGWIWVVLFAEKRSEDSP